MQREQLHAPSPAINPERPSSNLVYSPELSTPELIVLVGQLLVIESHAERLICRYLADLADRIRQRRESMLYAYADELQAARAVVLTIP